MTLFNMRRRVLPMAGLISSGLLMGCATHFNLFERFYKPATPRESTPAIATQPRARPNLVYSHDPDKDGRLLQQLGYVLIGTTSFNGEPDLSYTDRAVSAQGQKVGAAIVLLKTHAHSTLTSCCWLDESVEVTSQGSTSYTLRSRPHRSPSRMSCRRMHTRSARI
jgi:hypothetical protein